MFDIVIIGAGIIGCQLAYDLSRFDLKILVLEKNLEILNEVSSANSGIIHPGYDPEEGTLKAKLNLLGAQRYPDLCQKLHVDYQQVGSLVCSTSRDESDSLTLLMARANLRGIPCLRLTQAEVRQKETHLSKEVIEALYFPTTAIIMPWEMGYALMDAACLNGVELKRQEACVHVEKHPNYCKVMTEKSSYRSRLVINASGLKGDEVAKLFDPSLKNRLIFKKGQYFVSDILDKNYISHVLFPVPSSKGKGVLAVKTTEGNLLFGPTSELCENGYDHSTTPASLFEIESKITRLIQPLPKSTLIRQFAGMRPSSITKDFIIEDKGFWIDVIGIDSPGLASSPGISSYVIETMIQSKFDLKPKETILDLPQPNLHRLTSHAKWNQQIKLNPKYGHVVCVCENVSEQEIIDAIHKPAGARSVKGVKRRVRPGSGRCQGGFCENRIVQILSQELQIPVEEVCYDDSPFLAQLEDTI